MKNIESVDSLDPSEESLDKIIAREDCNHKKNKDPESNLKVKSCSRFSLTFKRLSRPSKKQQKQIDGLIVSDGGDLTDFPVSLRSSALKEQKKRKFKIRFLKGLKKPSAKNVLAENSFLNDPLTEELQSYEWHENSNENNNTNNEKQLAHSRTIKITISSKKIEQVETLKGTDYLIPDDNFSIRERSKKEELESDKTKTARFSRFHKNIHTNISNEKKCFITQSERDTPPNEIAPQLCNVIFESHSIPKTISKPSGCIVAPTIDSFSSKSFRTFTNQQAELMQNYPSTPQRGHRFPRPTTSTNGEKISVLKLNSADTKTTYTTPELRFALQSHILEIPQTTSIIKSNEHHLSNLVPSTLCNVTPMLETRSTHHHTTTKAANELGTYLRKSEDLVTTVSGSRSDEVVSPVESAKPAEYHMNNFENLAIAQYSAARSPNTNPKSVIDSQTVPFVAGSAVYTSTEFADTIWEPTSIDSNKSSDSQSPISESSRRRIRYIAQPTLREDLSNLQRRRETLRYQAGISDYSLESDDSLENQMPAFGDLTLDQEMEPTIMTSPNPEKREHLYKILVIGELGTGKTSFIKRYVHQFFSQNYRATIGVDFALKVLHWDANTIVRLQLWDIAGQERFGNMTRVYYKEAVGAFIVFDVTRSGTFDCVTKWKEDLDSKVQLPDGSPIPCILLANKCDQEKQGLAASKEKMDEYVRENDFAGWFETSAKENINIDEAARALVNKILLNDKLISSADFMDSEKFNLNSPTDEKLPKEKSKCLC